MEDQNDRQQQQQQHQPAEDRRSRHFRLMNSIVNTRAQQQVSPPRRSSQSSSSSSQHQPSISSQNNLLVADRLISGNYNKIETNIERIVSIETPCKQIAELQLKQVEKTSKPKATGKLLGSKSLSQLMPKNLGLFSKRPKPVTSPNSKKLKALTQRLEKQTNSKTNNKLSSSKSFPNGTTTNYYKPSQLVDEIMEFTNELAFQNQAHPHDMSLSDQLASEPVVSRLDSASLIGFPRQSTSNSLGCHRSDAHSSMVPTDLSPIVVQSSSSSAQNRLMQNVVASTPTIRVNPLKVDDGDRLSATSIDRQKLEGTNNDQDGAQKMKPKSSKYKPFKNTALVLRDVKNSIGLRMKAKQSSQAFERLTNEISTPPTKLYSPFYIYTPDAGENNEAMTPRLTTTNQKADCKSKKRLNLLNKNNNNKSIANKRQTNNDDSGNCSMSETANSSTSSATATPKDRIALQHKKHLLNANKFSFDSPTGRLRETVKDVEQFQQCIEDISRAIRARAGEGESESDQLLF